MGISSGVKVGAGVYRYRYNGKEFSEELGLYDYGARWYDPATARWGQVDPSADSYPSLSPYNYVANNPIIGIDADGRDYILIFDHKNNTLTIQGTYYTQSGDSDSFKDASSATNFWNNQSGQFEYSAGKGDDAVSYTVNFDLKVEEADSPATEATKDNSPFGVPSALNPGGGSNVYEVAPDSDSRFISENPNEDINGATKSGDYIRVKESRKGTDTGAHEIGHTLATGHQGRGLMAPASNDAGRSGDINRPTVRSIIQNGFKQTKDAKGSIIHINGNAPNRIHKGKVKQKR